MIVVSHRGPYRFEANDDGTFTAEPGAGGLASALGALLDADQLIRPAGVGLGALDRDVTGAQFLSQIRQYARLEVTAHEHARVSAVTDRLVPVFRGE